MKTSASVVRWRAVVVAAVGLLLVGCAAGGSDASVAGSTGGARSAVSACTPAQTRAALASFVAAFDRGDYRRLNTLFAGPSWFQWYSSSGPGLRVTPAANRRGTLISYFRARHAKRDRFRLASFTFTGNSNGYGNFVFKMKRSAADFRHGAWFGLVAKGAALCDGTSVKFIVMSLGGPDSDTH